MSNITRAKKITVLFLGILFLSGCATYKFHHGKAPYDKGYVVSRDDYAILEYTVGRDNQVPPLKLAKERFNRRRKIVEDYYKKMGYIENHFKMAVYDPSIAFLKLVGGVFRLPFIAVSDYRYEHNPKYKEKIKKLEAEQDIREANRIKSLKEKLNEYLANDLTKEPPITEVATIPEEEKAPTPEPIETKSQSIPEKIAEEPSAPPMPVKVEQKPPETKPPRETITLAPKKEEKPVVITEKIKKPPKKEKQVLKEDCKAVIIAKPLKGYSPLRVQFNGQQSFSPYGKIIFYSWEFGDGDVSTKPNPVNTYWSTTFGSRYFTTTLTVKDEKGNTATSSAEIEVMTK